MNKKIYNEDLTLNLILNGDKLQKGSKETLSELYKLDQETRKLQMSVAKLELEKRRLNKTDADYKNKLALVNAEIKMLNERIQSNYQAMMKMRQEIGLTGMTINQLNSHLKVLKASLANATDPGIMRRLRREIEQTNVRLTTMTTGASRLSQAWTKLARDANKYSAAIGWISIISFTVGNSIGNMVTRLGFLDRKLTGVMKTTGMTREEVLKLKREFDTMETPTKADDLVDMTRIAGKLGIEGYDNIKKFVRAVDILHTSLSEDLNLSAEETSEKVGKLVNSFRLTSGEKALPLDEALLRTGSLLNQLDKSSVASAGTILEYMTRLSSLGTTANYPMESLAGLAATLETVNIPAERGSTALRNIISNLGKYSDKFSRLLGVTSDEYKKMVETDINGTFLKLIELASAGDKSILDVVKSMGDFEISGVRVAEVFGALGQNLDVVREQQEIARRAFESSASVMHEYLITLEDYQASIDLQKKRVKALSDEYNLTFKSAVYNAYKGFVDLLYLMRDSVVWIYEHRAGIGSLILAYTALKAAKIADMFIGIAQGVRWLTLDFTRLQVLVAGVSRTFRLLRQATLLYMAGEAAAAKNVLRLLFSTINPVKAILTGVVALTAAGAAAWLYFSKGVDKVTKALREMDKELSSAKQDLNGLFESLKKTNEGTEERAILIKTINEQYGTYLSKMLSEKDGIDAITLAQTEANKALAKNIALKYENSRFDEIDKDFQEKLEKEKQGLLTGFSGTPKLQGAVGMQLSNLIDDAIINKQSRAVTSIKLDKFIDQNNIRLKNGDDATGSRRLENLLDLIDERMVDLGRYNDKLEGMKYPKISKSEFDLMSKKAMNDYDKIPGDPDEEGYQSKTMAMVKYLTTKIELQKRFNIEDKEEIGSLEKKLKLYQDKLPKAVSAMSEDEYKAAMEQAKIDNMNATTLLNRKKGITEEERKLQKLQLDLAYLRRQKGIEEDRGSTGDNASDLPALRLAISEKELEISEAGKKEIKAQDKIDKKLLDMNRIRIEAMKEGIEKELAEENELSNKKIYKYLESAYSQAKIDAATLEEKERMLQLNADVEKAISLEVESNLNKRHDIRLKYLDKELENNTIAFSERLALLEIQNNKGLLTEKEYLDRKKKIEDDFQKELVRWNKKVGDIDTDAMDAEIANAIEKGRILGKTEEETQIEIARIKKEYANKATRDSETHAQKLLRIEKDKLSDEQKLLWAKGEESMRFAQMIGQGVGNAFGAMFDNDQNKEEAFMKGIVETVLNAAHTMIQGYYAVILARNLATQGLGGIATTAIEIALIEVAFGVAQAALSSWDTKKEKVNQAASGIYPVVGKDDGRTYMASYQKSATTGIYGSPTLIAERPEMVIDYPTLRNMQMNAPGLIQSIMAMRVPQYASGKYPDTAKGFDSSDRNSTMTTGLDYRFDVERFEKAVERMEKLEFVLSIEDYERKRKNWEVTTGGGLKGQK